jgi:very-short-patch-repair endonuclease
MSPLSVAQFLSANQKLFDVVIFDEASQITVPDAIGAIARGKNCIIVGDQKQMPPTRFFERGPDEDENEEARDLESILDEAIASQVKRHQLTGHYRSKHESLITFSNHAYYGGSLVTFPSAETKESAVTFHRVDGIYARGKTRTNEIEARAVVEEVTRRLRDPELCKLSIGVVTLNSEQQRLILDLLDGLRRGEPELEPFFHWSNASGPAPVFVKNLETVQGDERDVILLSIGYGPTEHGAQTMYHNFGPLNKDGGERRLNVAITRATTEVMVFASFDASMIDLTRTKANAVADLKHYIDYADRGKVALAQAIRSFGELRGYDSDFEKSVAEGLRKYNWNVRTQIGVSKFRIDLGIIHPDAPGKFLAGVECDGATYHSSKSARDRDRVRQEILERLGWRLFRIWSTDFFNDEKRKIQELDERLRKLLKEDRERAAELAKKRERASATSMDTKIEFEDKGAGSNESGGTKDSSTLTSGQTSETSENSRVSEGAPSFPNATDRVLESGDPTINPVDFYEPTYQRTLKYLAIKIIDQEGPVTFNFLSKRIARMHNFLRTGREIKRKVWQASHNLRKKTSAPGGEEIFWPEDMEPAGLIEFRGLRVNDTKRNWEEVPHPEKLGLVQQVLNTNPEDPARKIAKVIGYSRVKQAFRTEIEELKMKVQEL